MEGDFKEASRNFPILKVRPLSLFIEFVAAKKARL
jgi:hypothetical protein